MKLLINKFLKYLKIIVIFRPGYAFGEQLYMSSLVKKLKRVNNNYKIILLTTCPDLFYNNPYIKKLVNIKKKNFLNKIIIFFLNKLLGTNIILFYPYKYHNYENKNYLSFYPNSHHVIEINSERMHIKFEKKDLKNFFYFSKEEEEKFNKKFSNLKNFKLIQSETKDSYTKNKNWDTKKFQEIINFYPDNQWVQIGLINDYKLKNVIDLTGKTSIRELAFLIKNTDYLICLEGFLAHLSSCFNTKTYVIYSGTVPVTNLLYENIIPISKSKNLECSPCYFIKDCPMEKKYCTDNISVKDVTNNIIN